MQHCQFMKETFGFDIWGQFLQLHLHFPLINDSEYQLIKSVGDTKSLNN